MTLALLGLLALATTPNPTPLQAAYTYRTPDGVDHYVGSADDIPAAYRAAARRIELTGVPLNDEMAKGWNHDTTHDSPAPVLGKSTDITLLPPPPPKKEPENGMPGPTTYAVVAAILLCLFPALLLGWLRAPRKRVPILALAIADLALGLGVALYSARQMRPDNASDLVDLNPLHAWDNARKVRDLVKAADAERERQLQEMDKASPTAGPSAPKPAAPNQPIKQP